MDELDPSGRLPLSNTVYGDIVHEMIEGDFLEYLEATGQNGIVETDIGGDSWQKCSFGIRWPHARHGQSNDEGDLRYQGSRPGRTVNYSYDDLHRLINETTPRSRTSMNGQTSVSPTNCCDEASERPWLNI